MMLFYTYILWWLDQVEFKHKMMEAVKKFRLALSYSWSNKRERRGARIQALKETLDYYQNIYIYKSTFNFCF